MSITWKTMKCLTPIQCFNGERVILGISARSGHKVALFLREHYLSAS